MSHEIIIGENNVIEIILENEVDIKKFDELLEKVKIYADEIRHKNLPILILLDLTACKDAMPEIIMSSVNFLKNFKFDRVAGVGGSVYILSIARLVSILGNRQGQIKFYKTRDEAMKWLQGGK